MHRSYGLRELHGAVADADAVYSFLSETLRVPENRIKNLRNEEATRATIEMEIMNLGGNPAIKEDDPILIYYAGHGAEANAPCGWPSANGKIQMLVPHDFNPSGRRGKKSDDITGILDCCHSASGTRAINHDANFAVRGIKLPEDYTIPQDLSHDIPHDKARASVAAKRYEKTGLLLHVLLSACKHGQEASERDGHGAFTSVLLSLLKKSGVDKLTYTDVIANLPDLPAQNPQCEGFHQSRSLFNSKVASPQRKLYPIRSSDKPGQYVLEAGEAHGITNKAEFVVFTSRDMSSALGPVIASNITAFTTTCDFSARGNETPFPLTLPGFALQTRVGERQDISLLIERDERLLGVREKIVKEMQIITADGDVVHFEIMDKLCQQHGLTCTPFHDVKIDNPDFIHRILRSSADFYWHLRHSQGGPLAGAIMLECMKLKETGLGFEAVLEPDGENLNNGGVIFVDDEKDAKYGFKITNTHPGIKAPLYVSMFYFDASDLSIAPYYQPGSAKDGVIDFSLPPGESLTIGYGARGTPPSRLTPRKGQGVGVGFLKLFSTEYMNLSGIVQSSPLTECRESIPVTKKSRYVWDTMCVAIVQKNSEDTSHDCESWGGKRNFQGMTTNYGSHIDHFPWS
ncbi:uncharacterized protein ARMOST_19133 [Armillaria ostoyae]|uniref:Peptidase C14 caspase domain-containing protein n=1 Tax=Armillaria ostoyae TaxID=47428 RepID=A0A284S3P0_ARMOS|nr:uncharacterized protein ARMOST_19133 [Armillaria ostoyae]